MMNALALAATFPLYEYLRHAHSDKIANSTVVLPLGYAVLLVVLQLVFWRQAAKADPGMTGPGANPAAGTAIVQAAKPKPQQLQTSHPDLKPSQHPISAKHAPVSDRNPARLPNSTQTAQHSSLKAQQVQPLTLSPEARSYNPALRGALTALPALTLHPNATSTSNSFLRQPKSFSSHRPQRGLHFSIDTVPRQTILKAIVSSRPRLEGTQTSEDGFTNTSSGLEYAASVVRGMDSPSELDALAAQQQTLDGDGKAANPLQSPCFFHQQFDEAVNIQKVLDEISHDEYLSHSRLVQTAAGVREVARQLAKRTVRTEVKNVMIVTKARDNNLVTLTREVAHWLMKTPRFGNPMGVNVYVDLKLKNSKRFDAQGMIEMEPAFADMLKYWTPDLCWTHPEKFDLVLTLGGDGTVLFTSWLFQRIVPPILSFSLGSLGFLTNFQFESYKEHLNKVLDNGMRVNLKMRFTCTIYRDVDGESKEAEQFEVLNELVIDRGPSPYVSQLELYSDHDLITVVQADGCIFSTPTGSTAYSLSAGGSLVHPDIPAILLTPICPHTLSFRPMIFNDSMPLRVCVPKDSRATAWCAFDGRGRIELRQGDMVTIAASQYPFPTVLSSHTEWIDAVSRTLRWNSRAAAQKGWDGDSAVGGDEGEPEFDIDTDSGVYMEDGGEASPGGIVKRNMALFMS